MGVTIKLAGQNITAVCREDTIDIESILGQGPGVPASSAARTTTFKVRSSLGPVSSAYGAGQAIPGIPDYKDTILGLSPVAYWRLNDVLAPTMADATGNHPGTYNGGCRLSQNAISSGDIGGAGVLFDGASGYATVPYSSALNTAQWSVAVWVSPNVNANFVEIVSNQDSPNQKGWYLYQSNTDHHFYINVKNGGGSTDVQFGSLTVGAWSLLVATYDGTNVRTYLNGALINTTAASFTAQSTYGMGIAADHSGVNFLPGMLSEVAIFNFALSGAQVTSIYSVGSTAWTPVLVRQGELIVQDASGNNIFGGYVSDLEDVTDPHSKQRFTQVTAVDYWQDLDRVGVNLVYVATGDTTIIQQVMATYAPWIDTSLVDFTNTNFVFPRVFLRGKTLAKALQYIADATGFDIWIDGYKRLHYVSPTNLGNAPFQLSDTPDMATSFPHKLQKGPEQDDTAIINRVTFYGGKRPSGDFTQDISPQANGNNTTFTLAYYPRESSSGKIVVTVNGVGQVVGYASGAGANNTLKSAGGNCDVLVNPDAQTLQFNTAPASGATVHCTYRYQTPLVVTDIDSASYAFFGRYYDGFISDESVQDVTLALARCRTLLAEQNYGLLTMTVRCWQPGVQAGMQLYIKNATRGLAGSYVVQQVKVVPLGGGQFAYDIDLGAWNWHVADILVAGAHAAAVTDTTLNEQVDIIQANLGSFTVHMAFTNPTRSTTTGVYYARATAVGDGHDAYPGASTIGS